MAIQLCKMLFQQAPYGWTEEFFTGAGDTLAALKGITDLAVLRGALLGSNSYITSVEASDIDVPGDSDVKNNPNTMGRVSGNVSDDPWLALKVSLIATDVAAPGAPQYHRTYPIRGYPFDITAVSGNTVDGVELVGNYLNAMNDYRALLKSGRYLLKVADKTATTKRVTGAAAVGGNPGLTDFTIPGLAVAAGTYIGLHKFTELWKVANGRHRIISVAGNVYRLAVPFNGTPVNNGAEAQAVVYKYLPITGATFIGLMKRATGRTTQASRGQKKRRPSPTV